LTTTGMMSGATRSQKSTRFIALLATEDRWCKFFAESSAGRRCLWGAIWAEDAATVLNAPILDAIKEVAGRHYESIDAFNDHPATTHATVLKVLHQAPEHAKHDAVSRSTVPVGARTVGAGSSSRGQLQLTLPRLDDPGGEHQFPNPARSSVILPGVRRLRFGFFIRFIRAAARWPRWSVRSITLVPNISSSGNLIERWRSCRHG
jgi:hypothetical protein